LSNSKSHTESNSKDNLNKQSSSPVSFDNDVNSLIENDDLDLISSPCKYSESKPIKCSSSTGTLTLKEAMRSLDLNNNTNNNNGLQRSKVIKMNYSPKRSPLSLNPSNNTESSIDVDINNNNKSHLLIPVNFSSRRHLVNSNSATISPPTPPNSSIIKKRTAINSPPLTNHQSNYKIISSPVKVSSSHQTDLRQMHTPLKAQIYDYSNKDHLQQQQQPQPPTRVRVKRSNYVNQMSPLAIGVDIKEEEEDKTKIKSNNTKLEPISIDDTNQLSSKNSKRNTKEDNIPPSPLSPSNSVVFRNNQQQQQQQKMRNTSSAITTSIYDNDYFTLVNDQSRNVSRKGLIITDITTSVDQNENDLRAQYLNKLTNNQQSTVVSSFLLSFSF
jgi:hypothetical protein